MENQPPKSPNRAPQKVVDDDLKDLRMEIKKRTTVLQKLVHFEFSIKPHLDRLATDINEKLNICEDLEKQIDTLQKQIKQEQDIKKAMRSSKNDVQSVQKKVEEINELEEQLQALLERKAHYLKRAESYNNY